MLTAIVQGGGGGDQDLIHWHCSQSNGIVLKSPEIGVRIREEWETIIILFTSCGFPSGDKGLNPQIGESTNSEVIPVPTTSFPKSEFFKGQPEHTQPQLTTDVYILEVVHSWVQTSTQVTT